jgi:hypothetical protein
VKAVSNVSPIAATIAQAGATSSLQIPMMLLVLIPAYSQAFRISVFLASETLTT